MKICRYDDDRLGVVEGQLVYDVSAALDVLPTVRWPVPVGDLLLLHWEDVLAAIRRIRPSARAVDLASVRLKSPVANPSKIIGAPVNYQLHIDEATRDVDLHQNRPILTIDTAGPFLKSVSSLVGPSEGVALGFPHRRHDHEVELAVVIGKAGRDIPVDRALEHVAGYAIGLDMTLRGPEDRSVRKSLDTYSVLGPWLVTADEIEDPNNLELEIRVNGQPRQHSNTSRLIYDVQKCIAFFSSFYTLLPGDIIMTGTPEGVATVEPGDVMTARIERIGTMDVAVRAGRA
jgi:2,4-diketo-3-deoxy-L-fuconate hydrolase